jgi:hypothetical protein
VNNSSAGAKSSSFEMGSEEEFRLRRERHDSDLIIVLVSEAARHLAHRRLIVAAALRL